MKMIKFAAIAASMLSTVVGVAFVPSQIAQSYQCQEFNPMAQLTLREDEWAGNLVGNSNPPTTIPRGTVVQVFRKCGPTNGIYTYKVVWRGVNWEIYAQ